MKIHDTILKLKKDSIISIVAINSSNQIYTDCCTVEELYNKYKNAKQKMAKRGLIHQITCQYCDANGVYHTELIETPPNSSLGFCVLPIEFMYLLKWITLTNGKMMEDGNAETDLNKFICELIADTLANKNPKLVKGKARHDWINEIKENLENDRFSSDYLNIICDGKSSNVRSSVLATLLYVWSRTL